MPDTDFLRSVREAELQQIRPLLPRTGRLLEIGAGAGWQSRLLNDWGYEVTAVDVPVSNYALHRIWPIIDYDGRSLPFRSETFDAIFSSNVLEHIVDFDGAMAECSRVLVPGGVAIHIVPSAAWRLWSLLGHYPAGLRHVLLERGIESHRETSASDQRAKKRGLLQRILLAERHGEHGSALGELRGFSRNAWLQRFSRCGWVAQEVRVNHLIYSGHGLLGVRLSLPARRFLAGMLGSACHVFALHCRQMS